MSDKMIIKNCPCIIEFKNMYFCAELNNVDEFKQLCADCTDCILKQIVELCSKAHGQIIGYEKGKVYDGKNLIEANLPLTTINPLAKEILDLLNIQEVEINENK